MDSQLSIHEIRRRAPLHYLAKANNARFAAYILSRDLPGVSLAKEATEAGYHGTPNIALHEAFRREAAIALELIVKAVIAEKNSTKMRATRRDASANDT